MKKIAAAFVVSACAAALAVQGTSLYAGQPAAASGLTVSNWGGGKISETKDVSLAGGNALKVETTNFFQGGLLEWSKPADLTGPFGTKDALLTLGVWNMEFGAAASAPASSGGGGGRFGGMDMGGGEPAAARPASAEKLSKLRLVIRTSDGKLSEAILPVQGTARWVRTGIPVSRIPGFAKTNKMISRIAVSGNAPGVFYLGEIAIASDQTPIQGSLANTDMNIGKGSEVTLTGNAEAGITPVEFSWDFDHRDGLQDDATGQSVTHKFRVPGQLTVTLTIRDIYGLKKPWVGTFKVTVNP